MVSWNGRDDCSTWKLPGGEALACSLSFALRGISCRQIDRRCLQLRVFPLIPVRTAQLRVRMYRIPPVISADRMRETVDTYVSQKANKFEQMCYNMADSVTSMLEAVRLREAQAAWCAARM